jgi:hypothetical protein
VIRSLFDDSERNALATFQSIRASHSFQRNARKRASLEPDEKTAAQMDRATAIVNGGSR